VKKTKQAIFAISGVAGSGKDSVIEKLWDNPDFATSVSYTDRPIRPGDIPGRTYNFISKEEFDDAIANKEFVEWEQVRGEYRYGRKKADMDKLIASGKTIIMHVDVVGAQKFKKLYQATTIFIMPPSLEEAIRRIDKRGSDTEEAKKVRIDRYSLEMSYKNKFDHILVNDDLGKAQEELVSIINKENYKRLKNSKTNKIVFLSLFMLLFVILSFGSAFAFYQYQKSVEKKEVADSPVETVEETPIQEVVETPKEIVPPVKVPTAEVKKKITTNPPKTTTTTQNIAETTKKNTDGSTTTTVSTGGAINESDLTKISDGTVVNSPDEIPYIDETGKYPDMGKTMDEYLKNILKWKTEVSSMKGITLRNAGATGWNGQYLGSYTISANDIITSAKGSIIINTYYIETDYCSPEKYFPDCESEYAKFIFAHEYGHHYTLYHKWIDWNLKNGIRFPDSYYSLRPLSKTATATDYSLGWSNCEIEIIAEDYSYFFSGYGLHQMRTAYGYPSTSIKNWLINIGDQSLLNSVNNSAPTVSITAPAEGATLSGIFKVSANADDDLGVSKVSFYIGDNLVGEDVSSPYEFDINSTSYANGAYVLKTVASDGTLTAEKTINVIFENAVVDLVKPTISILSPATNPFDLVGNQLSIRIQATDNVAIDRIEAYFEGEFQQSWKVSLLNLSVSFQGLPVGIYNLMFKTFDTAGNSSEVELVVNKSE
jgi:guanylate kinase